MTALAYAKINLFEPLGIHDVYWPADPQGYNHGWGDLALYPQDMARLGYLFLHQGRWGLIWKPGEGSLGERLHYSLLTLAALLLIPFLLYWNLFVWPTWNNRPRCRTYTCLFGQTFAPKSTFVTN